MDERRTYRVTKDSSQAIAKAVAKTTEEGPVFKGCELFFGELIVWKEGDWLYVRAVSKTKPPQFGDRHIRTVFLDIDICRSFTPQLLVDISRIPGLSHFIGQRNAKDNPCTPFPIDINRDAKVEATMAPLLDRR